MLWKLLLDSFQTDFDFLYFWKQEISGYNFLKTGNRQSWRRKICGIFKHASETIKWLFTLWIWQIYWTQNKACRRRMSVWRKKVLKVVKIHVVSPNCALTLPYPSSNFVRLALHTWQKNNNNCDWYEVQTAQTAPVMMCIMSHFQRKKLRPFIIMVSVWTKEILSITKLFVYFSDPPPPQKKKIVTTN